MAEPLNLPSTEDKSSNTIPDVKAKLTDLTAQAARQYSMKDYDTASDLYAQATELQAELNGEMAVENADLLYLYGRSLYHAGISQSDVLGGKISGGGGGGDSGGQKKHADEEKEKATADTITNKQTTEKLVGQVIPEDEASKDKEQVAGAANKPYFQITGDENWDDSDDEAGSDAEAGKGDGEEDDAAESDLMLAWDILELARVLFERKLESLEEKEAKEKGAVAERSSEIHHVRERLADVHDLLAELCLERDDFDTAISSFRPSLLLKEEMYPFESSVIAEAHYKLSLALEFNHIKTEAGLNETFEHSEPDKIEITEREEATEHMESAILSVKMRVQKEEALLASGKTSQEKETVSKESIDDLKLMIADMEQRLTELRGPHVSVEAAMTGGSDAVAGLLGSLLGADPQEQRARILEAMRGARDLTGLVRRKKPRGDGTSATPEVESVDEGAVNGHNKRKAEQVEEGGEAAETSKKARVEDENPAEEG